MRRERVRRRVDLVDPLEQVVAKRVAARPRLECGAQRCVDTLEHVQLLRPVCGLGRRRVRSCCERPEGTSAACADHAAERLVKAPVVGPHEGGQVREREDRCAPERRVCEVVERGPVRVRCRAACGRVVQHRQRNEPEVAVVHENGARALAGQQLAGECVARRYCGTARRSASGVDGQSREGDEVAGDEQSQRAGGVCGDERHVRCAVVDYVEMRGRAALEGAVVGGAVVGVARGERAQARRESRGHGLG